jgi:hypothetical protein
MKQHDTRLDRLERCGPGIEGIMHLTVLTLDASPERHLWGEVF